MSLNELKEALKGTLEAKGSLGQIKARIRAEIFNALDDQVRFRTYVNRYILMSNTCLCNCSFLTWNALHTYTFLRYSYIDE